MSAAPAMKPRLKYRLKIISGPHQNEIHTLDKDIVKIGRGDDNTIQLPRDGRISRNHVEVVWNGSEFTIRNLSQKNFVMVNDRVVNEDVLKPGVRVQIGETLIEVFEDGPILVPKAGDNTQAAHPVDQSPASIAQVKSAVANPPSNRPPPPSTSAYANPPANPYANPYSQPPATAGYSSPAPAPGYGAPPPAFPGGRQKATRNQNPGFKSPQSNSKSRFYIIVAGIVGLMLWLGNQETKPKEKLTFRTSQQVEYDRLQVEAEKAKLEERIAAQNNQLVRQAQENMVKGFRDFQQGNYLRAKENFASVLIKDPENELAKRYYHLSSIKFDELLQFHILQGLRYREKKNYRLCRSSFQSALIMIQNNNRHPKYSEIKDYFDECNLALEGRF